MRVTILAPGSRGDIQPYLGLGSGLARRGHAVRVVTTLDHARLVEESGLELAPVAIDVQAALRGDRVAASIEGGGLVASFREIAALAKKGARMTAEVALEAARGSDVVLTGFGGVFLADAICRKLEVPLVQAYNVPLTPTGAFPGVLAPGLSFGPRSRRLGHWLTRQALWATMRTSANGARRDLLGAPSASLLAPSGHAGLAAGTVLYGWSEAALPRGPEWGDDVEVTGFWFLDEPTGWSPPPALARFLAAGPKPVCIGFGSMSTRDPAKTTRLVIDAVKRSGQRAVLLAGWAGLGVGELPPEICALDAAPHAWLYPRMAVVVHHGGAGTTAAAWRAGVPAVIVPHHGDQPFWAARARELGVGPTPLPRARLTAERLAGAIAEVERDQGMAARAAALGERIRAEDGVGKAVAAIERMAGAGRS